MQLRVLLEVSYSTKLVDAIAVADANVQWISDNAATLKDYLAAKVGVAPADPPAHPAVPLPLPTSGPITPTPGPGPTEAPDSPASEWRLPSTVAPQHYSLMMVPFLGNLTFKGRVTITVLALEETDTITMHARDLTIPTTSEQESDPPYSNVQVYDAETGEATPVQGFAMQPEKDFLVISLSTNLTEKTAYNISIEFGAPLRQDNFGFYVSSYVVDNEFKYAAFSLFRCVSRKRCLTEP